MEGGPENNQEKQLSEEQALDVLKSERSLDTREQERLVHSISDPDVSLEVLLLAETSNRTFGVVERDHLAENIEREPESVYIFFINLAESGAILEMNQTEQWLAQRLRKTLEKIEDPIALEYIRGNILPFLPEENS